MKKFTNRDIWSVGILVGIYFLFNGGATIGEFIGMLIYSFTVALVVRHWCLDDNRQILWGKYPKVILIMSGIQTIIFMVGICLILNSSYMSFNTFIIAFITCVFKGSIFGAVALFIQKERKKEV